MHKKVKNSQFKTTEERKSFEADRKRQVPVRLEPEKPTEVFHWKNGWSKPNTKFANKTILELKLTSNLSR